MKIPGFGKSVVQFQYCKGCLCCFLPLLVYLLVSIFFLDNNTTFFKWFRTYLRLSWDTCGPTVTLIPHSQTMGKLAVRASFCFKIQYVQPCHWSLHMFMKTSQPVSSFSQGYSARKHLFDWKIFIPFYADGVLSASFPTDCKWGVNVMNGLWISDDD